MITRTLSVTNMNEEDAERIREVLYDVWGVRNVEINAQKGEVVVSYDEKAASFEDFQQAVIDSGYDDAAKGKGTKPTI